MANRRTDIDDLIQSFADTLADAVRDQVRDAVIAALADEIGNSSSLPKKASSSPAPASRTKTPKRQVRKKQVRKKRRAATKVAGNRRVRRSSSELEAQKQKVLDLLAAQPNLRAEEIGKALAMRGKGLTPLLRGLTDDGQLERSGVARGTRYRRAGDKAPAAAKPKASEGSGDAKTPSDKKVTNKASGKQAPTQANAKSAMQRVGKQGKAEKKATNEVPAKEKATDSAAPTADARPAAPTNGATYATASASEVGVEVEAKSPPAQDSSGNGSAPRDLTAEALRWIQNNPGDTSSIIAEALQTSTTRVRAVLQPLLDDGVIERQGDGRGATYAAR